MHADLPVGDNLQYHPMLFVVSTLPSVYVFSYFPFGFEGRIWDLIVSVPDHCLSFYFNCKRCNNED